MALPEVAEEALPFPFDLAAAEATRLIALFEYATGQATQKRFGFCVNRAISLNKELSL